MPTELCGTVTNTGDPVKVCAPDGTFALAGLIAESGLTTPTGVLLGRTTAATGAVQGIAVDTSLVLSALTLGMFASLTVVDNDTGLTQALTNTATAVTGSSATLAVAGTYLITIALFVSYNGATTAASRTITATARRTNNTPADLTNGTVTARTNINTTITLPEYELVIPAFMYVAAAGDIVAPFVSIDVVPTAGTITITETRIRATRIR